MEGSRWRISCWYLLWNDGEAAVFNLGIFKLRILNLEILEAAVSKFRNF